MKQYIDKSAVKAEIEKRISLFQKEKKTEKWSAGASQMNVVSLGARIAMLEEILSFLNTLEVKEVKEEPVSEDLEVAARKAGQKYFPDEYNIWARPNYESVKAECIFKESAEWQKQQMIDKTCEWLKEQNEMIGVSFEEDFIVRFKDYIKGE